MADYEPIEGLQDLLSDALVLNCMQQKKFLPKTGLSGLITEAKIETCLPPNASSDLIGFVCKHATKIFALVVFIGNRMSVEDLLRAMQTFQQQRITDESLPLENTGSNVFRNLKWRPATIERFCDNQWKFLSPFFTDGMLEYQLQPECVLPITKVGNGSGQGYFSTVQEAMLRADHQDILSTKNQEDIPVAVKELTNSSSEGSHEAKRIWEIETKALEQINKIKHPHLIRRIASISQNDRYSMLFPWADGGNLREFWHANPAPSLSADLILEFLEQFHGLATAIEALHNFVSSDINTDTRPAMEVTSPSGVSSNPRINVTGVNGDTDGSDGIYPSTSNWRHGDLKPDNILRFKNSTTWLGTLQIADLGLAKRHDFETSLRKRATSQKFSTVQYEAPEAVTNREKPRSRLYDIWSMGCIILETLIWLLYGEKGLDSFWKAKPDSPMETLFYTGTPPNPARVSTIASDLMMDILAHDPEVNHFSGTAIRDLLILVQSKLLVVTLPGTSTSIQCRIDANTLCEELANIKKKSENNRNYLFTGNNRAGVQFPGVSSREDPTQYLSPDLVHQQPRPAGRGSTRARNPQNTHVLGLCEQTSYKLEKSVDQRLLPLLSQTLNQDDWNFIEDNQFALNVFSRLGTGLSRVLPQQASTICQRCFALDFRTSFVTEDALAELKARSSDCDFCQLLLHTWIRYSDGEGSIANFHKEGSCLKMVEDSQSLPALSICRGPVQDSNFAPGLPGVQVGFAQLPEIGSPAHFEVQREWLEDCDKNHIKCRIDPDNPIPFAARCPTRVLDVGTETRDSRSVCLHETAGQDKELIYIALSHRWGDRINHKHCCATPDNIEQYRREIVVDDLPDTFKHAVKVTRELGVRYLWIDSLCIIQGKEGDFEDEAERMECVFSAAYCVIAASCATGTSDGFLRRRPDRKVVTFKRGSENPFYVCDAIDDFQHDVIEGSLNKRGWVLQERALARRTIYFTTKQAYWECGDGVRCETLTKMQNNQTAFLGDPNFPRVAMEHSKGGKIRLYESLYNRYSRLEFSRIEDRPIAIAGLERRLIRAFGTIGGFGIFGIYLGRGLLWQRDSEVQALAKIGSQQQVPSWSWMAYQGGITYMDLPFDGVDWEGHEIRSPWAPVNASRHNWHSTYRGSNTYLNAVARTFRLASDDQRTSQVIFDGGCRPEDRILKCVIIGRSKAEAGRAVQRHYVLIVGQKPAVGDENIYERVGSGFMPGDWITLHGSGLEVYIS